VTAVQIGALTAEADPVAGPRLDLIEPETNKWNAAYAWGDHALAGYLTNETDEIALAAVNALEIPPGDKITAPDGSQWIDATGGVWRVTSSEGFWRLTVAGTEYGCVTNASYDIPAIFSIWRAGGMVRYWSADGNASVMYDGVSTEPNIYTTVRCSPTTVETNYNQFAVYEEDLDDGLFEFYSDGKYTHIILEWFGTPVFTTQRVDGVAWQSDLAPYATTQQVEAAAAALAVHTNRTDNPHGVTAAQIGALTSEQDLAALRTYHYGSPDIVESPAEWFEFDVSMGAITGFYYQPGRENVVIPWAIGGVPVTAIGVNAFMSSGIVSVIAPQTVKTIGDNAFYYCELLTSVSLPQATAIGVYAFYYCTSLTSINLPQATTIGNAAFYYCTSLTSINLPQATTIGTGVFYYCTSLVSVLLPQVTAIGDRAFYGCAILTAVHMGQNAPEEATDVFYGVDLPPTVYVTNPQATGWGAVWNGAPVVRPPLFGSNVTAQAFTLNGDTITEWPAGGGGATNITDGVTSGTYSEATRTIDISNLLAGVSVELPEGIVTNEQDLAALRAYHYGSPDIVESPAEWFVFDGAGTITAFNWSAGRENVVIPWEIGGVPVTAIGGGAFEGSGIVSLIAPQTVTTIGDGAFYNCYSLTSINLPQATAIGDYAFYGCGTLASVSLPQVQTIGEGAFNNCVSLTSVSLPQAQTVGVYAFSSCHFLTSVSLPQAQTVGAYAFFFCNLLTSVSLPRATSIGDYAFSACYTLASVRMGRNAPAEATEVFYGIDPPPTVYVTNPQATGWGAVWNGAPVVRPPLYGSNVTAQAFTLNGDTITEWPAGGATNITDGVTSGTYSEATRTIDISNLLAGVSVELPDGIVTNEQDLAALRTYHYGSPDIVESPTNWFAFDGAGTITAFYREAGRTNVVIPWAIYGVPVTAIGAFAFQMTGIVSVIAPQTVTAIGDYAFDSCYSLTSVSLPQVTAIGDEAFYGCAMLTAVRMGQNAPAEATGVFAYITPPPTVYVTNPQATGWGAVWNGAPVVRPPLYGSNVTAQALTLNGDTITEWPSGGGSVPYTDWTGTVTPQNGTATVTYAHGNMPVLVTDAPCVLTLDPTGYGTAGVSRVSLSYYTGTNSFTFATNIIDYAETPNVDTNGWNTLLIRRVSDGAWKGVGL
jgi:hypothetical protein